MLITEFERLTKFRPNERYFMDVICEEYVASPLDKVEFCKQWLKNGGIQKAYQSEGVRIAELRTSNNNLRRENERLHAEIEKLRETERKYEQIEHIITTGL